MTADELSHYSTGTADIEYAFPFLPEGEFGELEGIAHRGDFDLRSHMEGKLDPDSCPLEVQTGRAWQARLARQRQRSELPRRYHRGALYPACHRALRRGRPSDPGFPLRGLHRGRGPDAKGNMRTRVFLKLHPRIAPIKAAVFPLVKKDGMPEVAQKIYRELKTTGMNIYYSDKGAIGKRYARQDEAGTPFCITVDGDTLTDGTVTIRERDTLNQRRIPAEECLAELRKLTL